MFWRPLEDVFKTSRRCLEDILKTSWRRLEDIAKTNILVLTKTSWRRLEDVFWRRKAKANIFVLIKTSWRRLEDVFWRRRRKTSSRCLQDVFIKTNVCWETSLIISYILALIMKTYLLKTLSFWKTVSFANPLQIMKNALFVLKIFKFFFWLFWLCKKNDLIR